MSPFALVKASFFEANVFAAKVFEANVFAAKVF